MTGPSRTPLFSIITATFDTPLAAFGDTAGSVLAQDYQDWEWILVDDRSTDDRVRARLREVASSDSRITIYERDINGGIVAASNDALSMARGQFIALLDHDDVLAPQALSSMAAAIDAHPDVDYLYSDQDLMTEEGETHALYYKPDWSPERLRHHMYTTHFSVLRRSLVDEVGGFRPGFDGSQDHDLVLRVTERARGVLHVGEILYHWREVPGSSAHDPLAKPWAWEAGVRAVQDHLDRVGIAGTARKGMEAGLYRIEREPDVTTPVSIVIPTIGSNGRVRGVPRVLVVETIRSILQSSAHQNLEIVVVYDSATPSRVMADLDDLHLGNARLRLVEFTRPFNFSEKCNVGALHATGDVLVFLNDDMEAHGEGLIEQLIAPLKEVGVGVTGAKLLFEDSRIQHAGIAYGSGTLAHNYYRRAHPSDLGAYGELWINREVSALTGACLAVSRAVFEEVGGFCEDLPVNYNDIDFCLKVRATGRRLLWLHDVVLFHFESSSRATGVHDWELQYVCERWGDLDLVRERFTNGVR